MIEKKDQEKIFNTVILPLGFFTLIKKERLNHYSNQKMSKYEVTFNKVHTKVHTVIITYVLSC